MRRLVLSLLIAATAILPIAGQGTDTGSPKGEHYVQSPPKGEHYYAQAQAPQATFRAATKLVVQTVSVKDRSTGQPIEGLTAADFVVTEDGVPQEIAFVEFQRVDGTPLGADNTVAAGVGAAPPPPPSPAVAPVVDTQIAVARPGDVKYQDKRLLVFYFDRSAMPPWDAARAYVNAQKYIDTQMTRSDLIAIIEFNSGSVKVRHDFTDDRAALREQLLRLMYNDDLDGDGVPDNPDYGSEFGQNDAEFNIFNTDRQLSALQTAVTMLRPLPEQKTLVYFGSGLRLNGSDNQAQLRATVNAAVKANVAIHPIDARGLMASAPLGDASQRSPGGMGMFTGALAAGVMSNTQRSQDTLYALAKDTGGNAMFDYNDLSLGIVNAARSVSSYYVVGYYSSNTATDGKFRRLKVDLTGGRQADLSYRQGYFADKTFARFNDADKDRQLEEAFMLEDPITDIPLAMEVNYFQLNRAEYFVPVSVKIPGSELALASRRGAPRTTIDFVGEVKDDYGITMQNIREKLEVRLDQETAAQLASRPIRYETGFTLLPGKYVLKILARDAETGRIGTYQAPFTIPNLNREETRLPISTVVLGSQKEPLSNALLTMKSAQLTVHPLVNNGFKLLPSVTRVFSRAREMHVYLQAYERNAETTQPLVVFAAFFDGEKKVMETAPITVTEGMHERSKAVPIAFSVPLAELAPGRYEVQISVLEPGGQKVAFWRAPIAVVP